ncbi:PREDICTED: uncharacterized protein LOC105562989, partial [Vollenhovia emeryi]|uniref:uncharacterized protein LOC105562989 n=1 Tax=Vollenhovia emeryi TaxID=411798 RepID=UPI0005F3C27C
MEVFRRTVHQLTRLPCKLANNIETSLQNILPELLVADFFRSNKNRIEKHNHDLKLKLIRKFVSLKNRKSLDAFLNADRSKWIINISDKQIPVEIKNFLSLGEGFGLPISQTQKRDRECSTLEIIKSFEVNCYKIPDEMIESTRSSLASSLHTFLNRSTHMNFMDKYFLIEFDRCKRFLRDNDDVFVTRADKGQVTVIMDRDDYNKRMTEMLNDQSTYKQVKKDPTKSLTSKLNSLIKTWRNEDIIDNQDYWRLNCTNGNLPRCYGLPKIHKAGFPLRVIVSSIGSPYGLACFIHDILQQSIKKPCSHIKDSWTLANIIKGKKINTNDILISLDVTALFTNIPREL